MNSKYANIRDTEGRLLSDLSIQELEALRTRCRAYTAKCAKAGIEREPQYVTLCAAVTYHIRAELDSDPDAREQFRSLREECAAAGCDVPALSIVLRNAQVQEIVNLLREALAVAYATDDGMIPDAYRDEIAEAIAKANEVHPTRVRLGKKLEEV